MKNPILWVVEIFDGKIWTHTGWVEFTKKEGFGQLQQTRFMFCTRPEAQSLKREALKVSCLVTGRLLIA